VKLVDNDRLELIELSNPGSGIAGAPVDMPPHHHEDVRVRQHEYRVFALVHVRPEESAESFAVRLRVRVLGRVPRPERVGRDREHLDVRPQSGEAFVEFVRKLIVLVVDESVRRVDRERVFSAFDDGCEPRHRLPAAGRAVVHREKLVRGLEQLLKVLLVSVRFEFGPFDRVLGIVMPS